MNIVCFDSDAIIPELPNHGDAGIDLKTPRDFLIHSGGTACILLNWGIEIPYSWVGLIKDRSSLAIKGLHVFGGVIDSSFRGNIGVVLHNASTVLQEFNRGDKIAQLVIVKYFTPKLFRAYSDWPKRSQTKRAEKGFGSTGR